MKREVLAAMCAAPCPQCPECGSCEHVAVFWFTSPEWTWGLALCGRAGVAAFCDLHER